MVISLRTKMWVVVIVGVVSIGSLNVKAQSPPAAAAGPGMVEGPGPDCMNLIYNMSDCLTYVEKGSKSVKPDKNCCPELAGMLDANPTCLCKLLGKSKDLPVELDLKRALKLPSVCKLQTPDVSLCSAVGTPIGAPAAGPGGQTSSESPAGMSPDAAGQAAAGKNGASSAHMNVAYLVASLAMAFALYC